MRFARLATLSATLLLALGACSGGGDESASRATTTLGGTDTTSGGPETTARPGSSDPFCNFVQTFHDRFGRISLGLADPQQLRTVMQDAAGAIREAQSNAPAAIRSDVGLLNEAFQRMLTIFQQANFDIARVNPTAVNELQSPQYAAASQRLENYMRQNCL